MTATCCHLEKETNPYKLRHFYFSHARYLDTSIKDNQFMNNLFGRSNNQTKNSGKIPSCRQSTEPDELAWLGAACKMKTLLIEQASARVRDSRGSLISARFCQSRPYIRHYTVRSYLYSLRIIQRICFVC